MSTKIGFAISHWAATFAFLASAYGWGTLVLRYSSSISHQSSTQEKITQAIIGIALMSTAFVYTAWLGQLHREPIFAILGVGWIITINQLRLLSSRSRLSASARNYKPWQRFSETSVAILAITIATPFFVAPLTPPERWDELMYHLPHAREWAHTGKLTINEWLRYPWAPFNLNVTYAAAMIIYDDIVPRTLHATMGILCAILIWLEKKHFKAHATSGLAALIWLSVSAPEYSGATIDLGLCLFLLTCFITACRWAENPARTQWLYAASLSAGMALGIKYQAMIFIIPFFLFFLLITIKGKIGGKEFFISLAVGLLPCILWYTRNWILTGNPINPLAPSLFGFYDWNQADMDFQLYDLKISKNWPPIILLPALFSPLVPHLRKSWFARVSYIICAYALIVWYFTSHHARYLMPAYPLLAWLSSATILSLGRSLSLMAISGSHIQNIRRLLKGKEFLYIGVFSLAVSVIGFQVIVAKKTAQTAASIATSVSARDEVLEKKFPGYAITQTAKGIPGDKLYQWGMENLIYFFPRGTRGDHFGPWRYRDMSVEPSSLARKMQQEGLDYIALPPTMLEHIKDTSDFNLFFQEIFDKNDFKIFARKHNETN